MEICVIGNAKTTRELGPRPFILALAHWALESDDYKQVMTDFARQGSYVILDNSLMEKGRVAMTLEDVLTAGRAIGAHEIVLPDVFMSAEANKLAVRASLNYLKDYDWNNWKPRLAAVAQGETVEAFVENFEWLVLQPEIGCVHIPKVQDTVWPGRRPQAVSLLKRIGLFSRVPVHLLGIWTDPIELVQYDDDVRSIDSALPVSCALLQRSINPIYGLANSKSEKPKRDPNFFNTDLTREQMVYLRVNVAAMEQMARSARYT